MEKLILPFIILNKKSKKNFSKSVDINQLLEYNTTCVTEINMTQKRGVAQFG